MIKSNKTILLCQVPMVYSNAEIAKKFGVSRPTVTRWLKMAKLGKEGYNFQLDSSNGEVRVMKTDYNDELLLQLALEGKKYKQSDLYAEIEPLPEFYDFFSKRQIIEIINDLQIKKEINLKFSYFGEGGELWNGQAVDKNYKTTSKTTQILLNSIPFLLNKVSEFEKVNIIDIGPGNGSATIEFVNYFHKEGFLNKYISVDISPEMNEIAKQTFDFVPFKSYLHDIEGLDIKEICFENKNEKIVNLIFFIGGTIGNFDDEAHIWSNLRRSLDSEDILIVSNKLDKNFNKTDFTGPKTHTDILFLMPKILGIEVNEPKLHFVYNNKKSAQCVYLELEKDYLLTIDKTQIYLHKGEFIEIWMHRLSTIQSLFKQVEDSQLDLVQLTTEKQGNHALIICQASDQLAISKQL